MRIVTRVAGVLLAASALGVLGSLAATAHADTPAPPTSTSTSIASQDAQVGSPQVSRGFHLYNLTNSPLTLKSITGDNRFEGVPPVGSVLQPGQYADFEVQFVVLSDQNDTITYTDGNGTYRANLEVNGYNYGAPSSTCSVNAGGNICTDPDDQVTGGNGTTITFLQPPGTTVTLDGSQAQQQATVLNQLCTAPGADATCKFTPTNETKVVGDPHQVGDAFKNPTPLKVDYLLERDDTVGVTDTLGVTVTAGTKLFDSVNTSISATYQHQWTVSHLDKESVTVHVDPQYKVWLENAPAMIRDTGNFTVTMGNTTYQLNDVHFDSPDPDGNGEWTLAAQNLAGGAISRTSLS